MVFGLIVGIYAVGLLFGALDFIELLVKWLVRFYLGARYERAARRVALLVRIARRW